MYVADDEQDALVPLMLAYPDASVPVLQLSLCQSLDATLHQPNVPRGFAGTLRNLRTPFGLASITSGPAGLSITLS